MATVTTWIDCYLNQPVKVRYLQGNLFTADNNAHKVGVKVYSSADTPASLSGTVSADIVRSDGVTVTESGTLSGNQCSVTVPAAAYAEPGTVIIVIKLTSSSVVTTLGVFACEIYDTSSGSILDPGTIIPDVEALIVAIDRAVASIPVDYSGLWTTLASPFSTGTNYTVGQYVTYGGAFYRFVNNHSAGAWSSSDVVAVNVGGELTDLKSAIHNQIGERTDNLSEEKWEEGYINANGTIGTDKPSLHSENFNPCQASHAYYVNQGTNYTGTAIVCWYDSSKSLISRTNAKNTSVTSPSNAAYFKMSLYNYGTTYNYDIAVFDGSTAKAYEPYYTAKDASARKDIASISAQVNSNTDNIEILFDELLEKEYTKTNLATMSGIDTRTNFYANIQGNYAMSLHPHNGYNSYAFFANQALSVYAPDMSSIDYYSIAVLKSPYSHTWTEDTGGVLIIMGSGTEFYRKSNNNLPTSNNPLSIPSGSLVCISISADETPFLYMFNGEYEPKGGDKTGERMIDVVMGSSSFTYYIPASNNRYLRFLFNHFVDAPSNADGWVQRNVALVADDKSTVVFPVVASGEWEMAVKLKDRPDFIGCQNHGSEITTAVSFFFDGKKTTITNGNELSCRQIIVIEKSTMYDPDDETTVVGYHHKKYTITVDEIKIEQKIEWVVDDVAMKSYVLMMPAVRGNDSTSATQVTDTYFDDKTLTEYNVATTSFEPYLKAYSDKGRSITLYGSTSGVFINTESQIKNIPASSFSFLSDAVYYNKIYMAYNDDNFAIHNGDVWEWTSYYRIQA